MTQLSLSALQALWFHTYMVLNYCCAMRFNLKPWHYKKLWTKMQLMQSQLELWWVKNKNKNLYIIMIANHSLKSWFQYERYLPHCIADLLRDAIEPHDERATKYGGIMMSIKYSMTISIMYTLFVYSYRFFVKFWFKC